VLLEPWYRFRLEVPSENLGRAMSDLQQMSAELDDPVLGTNTAQLTGLVPVAALEDYAAEVAAYTRGRGRLSCQNGGYRECHNAPEVINAAGYDPERDLDNTPDSVFCSHGAGTVIKWDKVPEYAHLSDSHGLIGHSSTPSGALRLHAALRGIGHSAGRQDTSGVLSGPDEAAEDAPRIVHRGDAAAAATDKELQKIFERTYGPIKQQNFRPTPKGAGQSLDNYPESRIKVIQNLQPVQEYLLVDGYNIIFAWEELKRLSQVDLDAAREALIDILCNYQGWAGCGVILVFDAYKVKNNPGSVEKRGGIYVVYTKQAETADMYIEKTTYEIARRYRVRVATSDGLEQMIILGHGAVRVSARMFRQEVEQAEGEIQRLLERYRS
jgi:predicted RNA-binding protein with PIN domain